MRGEQLPGQKRTPEQRERDRDEIAALLAQSRSIREITELLNAARPYRLSRQQVAKDADAVRQGFRAAVSEEREDILAETWAKYACLQKEGWRAWNDSEKRGHPDPRFLRLTLDAVAMQTRLAGLGRSPQAYDPPYPQESRILATVCLPDDGSGVTS